ncbi:alanine racemase [Leptospira sp. 2 VSF19]|uniref:Alanine racemase n=1 Tax=Leptospira soteropolitanensis TaxID=2950025 RepID=A0AAW5VEH6_9LEPT|nr:alanine racemase [Leptospira soteropolitanensis]MCW7493584.1 alanine racemase [Leptospira soteropolitanensis]MCW7501183.1 alanine racemase [Leptospira soteropolitanensis]MCW7523631.1 alanine racemase [Leptospira soteropolitanensis]MCW7527296.1 alanine racemase [Leptospira soteropolitanensis]MCW7531153.1 alanine racemase [Leptospira soteropolitanensis]
MLKVRKSHLWFFLLFIVAFVFVIKPKDKGSSYSEYFSTMNKELKKNGFGKPVVLLDLDRLDENLTTLSKNIPPPLRYRIVVKSLPSLDLLRYITKATNTKRLMVFHSGDLVMLLGDPEFSSFDILLGKPMPVRALEDVYQKTKIDRFQKIHWLVDSETRLNQYLEFAKLKNIKLNIVLEIDIGLHRGGLTNPHETNQIISNIQDHPNHLEFGGFMGYEPHVASVPNLLGDKNEAIEKEIQSSLEKYEGFVGALKTKFPSLFEKELILNGGGSKTYRFYQKNQNVVNDVSVGSALVMPTDFDVSTLVEHKPAFYIAAPVLKRLEGTTIPFLESISFLFPLWDPNLQVTYFIYGGAYLAIKESPQGLFDNSLYGVSTNQGILNGSLATGLNPDDYVFFRPTQSEKVMAEMGEVVLFRKGKMIGTWKCFIN